MCIRRDWASSHEEKKKFGTYNVFTIRSCVYGWMDGKKVFFILNFQFQLCSRSSASYTTEQLQKLWQNGWERRLSLLRVRGNGKFMKLKKKFTVFVTRRSRLLEPSGDFVYVCDFDPYAHHRCRIKRWKSHWSVRMSFIIVNISGSLQ